MSSEVAQMQSQIKPLGATGSFEMVSDCFTYSNLIDRDTSKICMLLRQWSFLKFQNTFHLFYIKSEAKNKLVIYIYCISLLIIHFLTIKSESTITVNNKI